MLDLSCLSPGLEMAASVQRLALATLQSEERVTLGLLHPSLVRRLSLDNDPEQDQCIALLKVPPCSRSLMPRSSA